MQLLFLLLLIFFLTGQIGLLPFLLILMLFGYVGFIPLLIIFLIYMVTGWIPLIFAVGGWTPVTSYSFYGGGAMSQ